MRSTSLGSAVFVVLMFMLSTNADAQVFDTQFGATMLNSHIGATNIYYTNMNRLNMEMGEEEQEETLSRQDNRSSGTINNSVFRVAEDPAVSARIKRQYLDNVSRLSGPKVAQQIESFYSRKNVRTAFVEMAAPYGLNVNDYADVFSAYLIVMWMTANDAPLPSRTQVQAVSRQAHQLMASNRQQATPKDLQMEAESMMYDLIAAVEGRQYAQKIGDRASLRAMADKARSNVLKSGMDLRTMVLTNAGLIRR